MQAEPGPGQRVRDVRRHHVLHRCARPRRRPTMPTFIWNINPEFAGHPNIFGNVGALCFTCAGQGAPFLAQYAARHEGRGARVRLTASSKACAQGCQGAASRSTRRRRSSTSTSTCSSRSPISAPQVAQMKQKGVQFVFTCIDQKSRSSSAKEMVKQHLNAVQYASERLRPELRRRERAVPRGRLRRAAVRRVRVHSRRSPSQKLFIDWMDKTASRCRELAGVRLDRRAPVRAPA